MFIPHGGVGGNINRLVVASLIHSRGRFYFDDATAGLPLANVAGRGASGDVAGFWLYQASWQDYRAAEFGVKFAFYADSGQSGVLKPVGQATTVLLAPMGVSQDNWPATVGLISGVIAKEVVIGTLNTLYAEPNREVQPMDLNHWWLKWQDVKASFIDSVGLTDADGSDTDGVVLDSAVGKLSDIFTAKRV